MFMAGRSVLLAKTPERNLLVPLALRLESRGDRIREKVPQPTVSQPILTGTRMQRLGSHHQRRAHRVEGKFLKVVAGLLGEDLIDHESLVAPPGCFELAG